MSHCLLPSSGFNVHKDYSVDGEWIFSGGPPAAVFDVPPTGTTHETSTLVVNPASATANATPLWVGIDGTAKFQVDEDGDLTIAGTIAAASGGLEIAAGTLIKAYVEGSYYCRLYNSGCAAGIALYGSAGAPAKNIIYAGTGVLVPDTLNAHLDQDDVVIKRDVDGDGGTYNEAGSLLHLWRDVTSVDTEAGNFLECSTDGSTPIFRVDKDGGVLISGSIGHYGSAIGVFSHSGSGQASHIADVPAAAGDPPTKAEFDAFATKFNQLLYDLEQWGWHANS